ncbi:hypothetical protein AKJ57_00470 [candidate division MSBL1 archaeon SCGC-AAA259A05]|uniref:Uncharacterized protein n=1 Tax=candidate division MSBL1 archaeon SCGC-AAA259A05 TaxID=1698259 RepID=A0A133UBT5_9EURY|nr:hypothetical protein AKJ57_00470 [candidate division MSBL1 archaeon SCGC-AAA259A05]
MSTIKITYEIRVSGSASVNVGGKKLKFLAICESLGAALSKDTVEWPRPKGAPARANKAPDHLTDRTEG